MAVSEEGRSEEAEPVGNGKMIPVLIQSFLVAAVIGTGTTGSVLTVEQTLISSLGSVPMGAQRVPMVEVRLTAPCSDEAIVHAVTLRHEGLGDASDLESVYAMSGLRRVSRASRPDGNKGDVTLRLGNLHIPPCGKLMLSIQADLSRDAAAGSEHRLTIKEAASIQASVPVRLLSSTHGTLAPRAIVPGTIGGIDVSFLDLIEPLRFGPHKTVARITFKADNVSDHLLEAITLTNDGSARDGDLERLVLENARGKALTTNVWKMDGERVRLVFSPALSLKKNQTILLHLRANITASRRRTIRFELEETSDLEATVRRGRSSTGK